MPEDPQEPSRTPLTAEEMLDKLDFLAGVEHSLCVEYLSIHCALGHELEPPDDGERAQRVAEAARVAESAAFTEMRHLRAVNRVLRQAGRPPRLERAAGIRDSSGAEIALGRLGSAQLERLPEREREIAATVDERFARLRRALESLSLPPGSELLSELHQLLDRGGDHSGLPAALRDLLRNIPPSDYIRALPREPADDAEIRLLELSDRCYRLIVDALQIWFDHEEEVFIARSHAVETMHALHAVNRLLVERRLLPTFGARAG